MCHIWWKRGERPPGLLDQRYASAYIYAAIEPGTDNAFALILPDANGAGMQTFLEAFAKTIAMDEHVALVLDGAGWHSGKALCVPHNITLVPLPPYSPELVKRRAKLTPRIASLGNVTGGSRGRSLMVRLEGRGCWRAGGRA